MPIRSLADIGDTQPLPFLEQRGGGAAGISTLSLGRYNNHLRRQRYIEDEQRRVLHQVMTSYIVVGLALTTVALSILGFELAGLDILHESTLPARERFDVETSLPFDRGIRISKNVSSPQPQAAKMVANEPISPGDHSQPTIRRILIPAIHIDAPVVTRGLDARGEMETAGPFDVAWYDFSSYPGMQGNSVFSGHVDHRDVGTAVFWDLRKLKFGDEIVVLLGDGRSLRYAVTDIQTVSEDVGADALAGVVGPTASPSVTLITCAGSFDHETGRYRDRLIVRGTQLEN